MVEVMHVHHLQWLENRVEIHQESEQTLLSALAVDQRGRKFTNCTALELNFEIKGESAVMAESPIANEWNAL